MHEKYAKLSILDRMVAAVERVRERSMRATAALEAAGIPYAVIGSGAAAAWIGSVDRSAVRNTQEVDILLRQDDFPAAVSALRGVGFIQQDAERSRIFLDGPEATRRDAVQVFLSGEKIRPNVEALAPDVADHETRAGVRVLKLQLLVQMMLAGFRLNDKVDLRDMLDVALIDATWKDRFSPQLAARLQELIDTPEG